MKKLNLIAALLATSAVPIITVDKANSFPKGAIASSSLNNGLIEEEFDIENALNSPDKSECDLSFNKNDFECTEKLKTKKTTNQIDNFIQETATYAARFIPLLNKGADGDEYSNMIMNDGKSLLVNKGYSFANEAANSEIQKIPFLSQTSLAINSAGNSETSFSLDSVLKLIEGLDNEGDAKTLILGQARGTTTTNSDGTTTNLGLAFRHRPNDMSMIGGNVFWDERKT